jgi:hypothetical protein
MRNGKKTGEHRWIMEETLGRKLLPDEVVHHIDGDRLNNAPSNLRVMSRAEHTRQHLTLTLDTERLKALYADNVSQGRIAKELGISQSLVSKRLQILRLPRRPKSLVG